MTAREIIQPILSEPQTPVGIMSKFLRLQLKMSMRQAGQTAGISHTEIRRIEAGIHSPTEQHIRSLARAYGVQTATIMGLNEEPVFSKA